MRKTRSRLQLTPVKAEIDIKNENASLMTKTPSKRRRGKAQQEITAQDLASSDILKPSVTKKDNKPKEINEDTCPLKKKSPKTSKTENLNKTLTKKAKPRKDSRKEFSKSNFSMTKILQNNSPKTESKGNKLDYLFTRN